MRSGLNLHALVNPLMAALHPNVPGTLYRSTGQRVHEGRVIPGYAPGEPLSLQFQSEGPTVLDHVHKAGQEESLRRIYLHSAQSMSERVAGILRPQTRNGDLIQVAETSEWYAGSWWLVLGTVEDFSRAGWQCVRAAMQVHGPEFRPETPPANDPENGESA